MDLFHESYGEMPKNQVCVTKVQRSSNMRGVGTPSCAHVCPLPMKTVVADQKFFREQQYLGLNLIMLFGKRRGGEGRFLFEGQ